MPKTSFFFFNMTDEYVLKNRRYQGDTADVQTIYKLVKVSTIYPKSSNLYIYHNSLNYNQNNETTNPLVYEFHFLLSQKPYYLSFSK